MNRLFFKLLFSGLLLSFTGQFGWANDETHFASFTVKQYQQMNEQEQTAYLESKFNEVARMITKRTGGGLVLAGRGIPDEALRIIKVWLDTYVRRIGSGNTRLWKEDLRFTFKRAATNFTPTIIEAFQEEQVPILLGIYIPMIETEYHNITTQNEAGAAGLFNWIAPTAREYGVQPSERTNVEKMATVAARYLKERFAEFGTDVTGVELALLGYCRSPKSVMRDLKQVSDGQEKPTLWTLVKNKDKLDHWFQDEGINYVPRFYAAAMIGENPTDFGIEMKPLSTYAKAKKTPSLIWGEPQPVRKTR